MSASRPDPTRAQDVLDVGSDPRPPRRAGGPRAALAVAVVAALVSATLLLADGSPAPLDPGGAPTPPAGTTAPRPGWLTDDVGSAEDNRPDLVRIDRRGRLDLTPGARVTSRIVNPLGLRPPRYSWAVSVLLSGERSWWLLESAPASRSSSVDPALSGFRTLQAWTAVEVATREERTGASRTSRRLVRFVGRTTELVPRRGVELLRQRSGPDVAGATAAAEGAAAAAEVRWRGRRWYVLALRPPGSDASYLPFVATATAADLDGFLTLALTEFGDGDRAW